MVLIEYCRIAFSINSSTISPRHHSVVASICKLTTFGNPGFQYFGIMKIFILLNLLTISLAEPPVGDSYSSALSSHDVDLQRSISSDVGYAASSRSGLSQQYGLPNVRSGLSQEYGVPGLRNGISEEYGAPNTRAGLSPEYSAPTARLSEEYGAPSARFSQEYNPSARGLSQNYGVPSQRNGLSKDFSASRNYPSDSYGAPLQRSSSLYSAPDFRSAPSEEYGTPFQRGFGSNQFARNPSQKHGRNSQFGANSLSREYGAPFGRSNSLAHSFGTSGSSHKSSFGKGLSQSRSSFGPSQSHGAPRSLSTQYGTPNARSSDSFSQGFGAGSSSYSASQRSLSSTYGAPNAAALSQDYGVPLGRAGLQTSAFPSAFASARSSPTSKYGAPSARDMPSDQYGVPNQYSSLSDQGYGYARGALDELLNQEPANYDFTYKVNDFETGSDFGHTETRQENKAEGTYFVVLPDGTKQVVEYEADERGFKPRISVEPAEGAAGRSGSGYDENASDLARSGDGPY